MTLTEAAYWSKRFGVIVGVVVVIIFGVLMLLFSKPKNVAPPEYLTANCACTANKEDFLSEELNIGSLELGADSELVFQVETASGQIDALPNIINVYEFDNKGQSLSSQLQAAEIANNLGFNPEGVIRKNEQTYVWLDTSRHRTLEVDARTLNFILTTDTDYIRDISSKASVPSDSEAISLATNVLRQANLLDSNYTDSTSYKEVYKIDINPDGSYSEAASTNDADLIRVDFYRRKPMINIRENIENSEEMVSTLEKSILSTEDDIFKKSEEEVTYEGERINIYNFSTLVLHESPVKTNISVYVGAKDENAQEMQNIYRIEYTNWPIKEYPCGTYELISPSEAIQKIQEGEGSLVSLIPLENGEGDKVSPYQTRTVTNFFIHNIYITYYEPEEEANFLQPIYVVVGSAYLENEEKAGFTFYVPAVNYELVTDAIESAETINDETTNTTDL